jgi:hypothetical protein
MNTKRTYLILAFVLIGAIQALAKPPIIILPCKFFSRVFQRYLSDPEPAVDYF